MLEVKSKPKFAYKILLYISAVLILVITFLVDVSIDSNIAPLYTLAVLFAWLLSGKYPILITATLATVLIFITAYVESQPSVSDSDLLIERIVSVMALWVAALLGLVGQRGYRALEANLANMNDIILERTAELQERLIQTEVQQKVLENQRDDLQQLNDKLHHHSNRLLASETRFRQLLHNVPIGIVILNEDGRVDHINKQFTEIFKVEGQGIADQYFSSLLLKNDRVRFDRLLEKFKYNNSGRASKDEFDCMVNGRKISLGIVLSFLDKSSSDYLVVAVLDITSRKKRDRLLLKTKEMAAQNAELEHLTQLASHDLQEPLKTVEGFVQLFEVKYSNLLDSTALSYLSHIKRATSRMSMLIKYLLDYSQLGSKPNVQVDLNELINQTLIDLTALINAKQAEIKVHTIPPLLKGNRQELQILFQNLISNALKFSKKGEQPKLEIGFVENNASYAYFVKDNGIGFDDSQQKRIFQMFQRLHSRSTYEGTGIGLAFCKKIITAHGGQIRASSRVGMGTTMWFTLSENADVTAPMEHVLDRVKRSASQL